MKYFIKNEGDLMLRFQKEMLSIFFILLITVLYSILYVNFNIHPFEDAAILMRYSDHLAHGHGIVWNIGEKPVDGATDFLFMVLVGVIHLIGIPLELATRGLVIFSHFLTIILIFYFLRKFYKVNLWIANFTSLFFALGPGLYLCASYFGTPFFALIVCISWILALKLIFGSRSNSIIVFFAIFSLLGGLIRPEGVIISFFMLLAIVVKIGITESKKIIIIFGTTFIVLGGIYFIWRWNYFGYPLPNPFYKKGGGRIYIGSLIASIRNVLILNYPFLPLFFLGFRSKDLLKLLSSLLIPIIGSTLMWILLSNEMNFGARFQYPILTIIILSWYPFVAHLGKEFKIPQLNKIAIRTRVTTGITIGIFFLGILLTQIFLSSRIEYFLDGRYEVAKILKQYKVNNYTIATTEAGLLPLYSEWRTIDTWGLNDAWIAHNGGITQDYLSKNMPELIIWHESPSTKAMLSSKRKIESAWVKMIFELKKFVNNNNYKLIAVFGVSPHDTHYYYILETLPERLEIINKIQNINYLWFKNGQQCIDYQQLPDNDS